MTNVLCWHFIGSRVRWKSQAGGWFLRMKMERQTIPPKRPLSTPPFPKPSSMQRSVDNFIYRISFLLLYVMWMNFLIIYGMKFWYHINWHKNRCSALRAHIKSASASQSDNAAFHCDDEDNTKEEEVYQDLCSIQSSIARRQQVFINCHSPWETKIFLWLICIIDDSWKHLFCLLFFFWRERLLLT